MACTSGQWGFTRSLKTHCSSSYILSSSKCTACYVAFRLSQQNLTSAAGNQSQIFRMSKANFVELCWVPLGVVATEICIWVPLSMKNHMETSQKIFCYLSVASLVLSLVRTDKSSLFLVTMSTVLKKILSSYIIKHSTETNVGPHISGYESVCIVRII